MLSYWEKTALIKNPDYAIIGSGIVGLSTALEIRKSEPNAQIYIFERGGLPWGASSKNAGFACFGSPSELLFDIEKSSENDVFNLVEKRYIGIEKLLKRCGSSAIDYFKFGSNELFLNNNTKEFEKCFNNIEYLNGLLYPILGYNVFESNDASISSFGFKKVAHLIKNKGEGQINTGKMMAILIELAHQNSIKIFNGLTLKNYEDTTTGVRLNFLDAIKLKCKTLIITTNGFAQNLIPNIDVNPARAQVLITKPIKNLKIKGTFHYDEGYYYFRNIDNRVLFGGGRNLAFDEEKTTSIATTLKIQEQLQTYLKEIILPKTTYEIDYSWAGIMGVGSDKKAIVKRLSKNTYCGVKMGGMGIAIGSLIAEELTNLIFE